MARERQFLERAYLEWTRPTGQKANDFPVAGWNRQQPQARLGPEWFAGRLCKLTATQEKVYGPPSGVSSARSLFFLRDGKLFLRADISLDLPIARTYKRIILQECRPRAHAGVSRSGWLESGSSTRLQATRELLEQHALASGVWS